MQRARRPTIATSDDSKAKAVSAASLRGHHDTAQQRPSAPADTGHMCARHWASSRKVTPDPPPPANPSGTCAEATTQSNPSAVLEQGHCAAAGGTVGSAEGEGLPPTITHKVGQVSVVVCHQRTKTPSARHRRLEGARE
mmetsp:Transcript_71738/g.119965  ORF Transcript_71738/g.119965 Transcript_71738/m.119965 type:complete len:139 (+) Transcript_71738:700-1116(+)